MKSDAILFGPFVGELCWEFYRFAPFAIYLKKKYPKCKLVVLTRPSRFDIYGQHADILVPLRLKNDQDLERDSFKLVGYREENYYRIAKYFKNKFKKRYNIAKHYYPDVRMWRYKVKWQFPRDEMDYDFLPRYKNNELAKRAFINNKGIFDTLALNRHIKHKDMIDSVDLVARLTNFVDDINSTTFGGIIDCVKLAKYVVGDIRYDISHLAVLLGIPLIHVGTHIREDFIKLLNPNNTPIILCDSVKQGIETYEDNF